MPALLKDPQIIVVCFDWCNWKRDVVHQIPDEIGPVFVFVFFVFFGGGPTNMMQFLQAGCTVVYWKLKNVMNAVFQKTVIQKFVVFLT